MANIATKETKPRSENIKKTYVLDTSVLLHDPNSIYSFKEHDIVILNIVFEELDNLKKGNDNIAYIARELHRKLEELSESEIPKPIKNGSKSNKKNLNDGAANVIPEMVPALFNGGTSLGKELGNIEIKTMDLNLHPLLRKSYSPTKPDHQILSGVLKMMDVKKGGSRIIIVSKDINMRLKCKSLGILVQDYKNDKVPNIDQLYSGRMELENENLSTIIDELYRKEKTPIFYEGYSHSITKEMLKPNMYFSLIAGKKHMHVRVSDNMEYFYKIDEKTSASGIVPRNTEQLFSIDALLNPKIQLVTLSGLAGTGKTLLAMAAGIDGLKKGQYNQVLIAAAMVTVGNREMGFLPGDVKEKVAAYMQGLFDNIGVIKAKNKTKSPVMEYESKKSFPKKGKKSAAKFVPQEKEKEEDYISIYQKEGKIEIQAISFIRGRSLNKIFFIVDEGQNLTPHEVKTIITRAGEDTKVIICGDVEQIDTPYLDASSNGLTFATHKMKGYEGFAHVTLVKGERSMLAAAAAQRMK